MHPPHAGYCLADQCLPFSNWTHTQIHIRISEGWNYVKLILQFVNRKLPQKGQSEINEGIKTHQVLMLAEMLDCVCGSVLLLLTFLLV